MLKTILLIWVFLWMYRYIGVLLYRIKSARSDDDSTRVNFSKELNLFLSVLTTCIQKVRPSLLINWPFLRFRLYDFSKFRWQSPFKSPKPRPYYLYILDHYWKIYFWPWIKISPYIVRKIKYWRRIWWIDERTNLRRSDWRILADAVRQGTKGAVKVLGVREEKYGFSPGVYTILLKLPKRASEIFGLRSSDNVFSKFREEANADNLRIRLRPHRYQDKEKHLRTKKAVAEIHHHSRIIYKEGNFCGPEWRRNFIAFLQKVIA